MNKDCPKKTTVAESKEIGNVEITPEDHGFRRDVTYEISYSNINYVMHLNMLFDTGSSISFIREQFIKQYDHNGIN